MHSRSKKYEKLLTSVTANEHGRVEHELSGESKNDDDIHEPLLESHILFVVDDINRIVFCLLRSVLDVETHRLRLEI